MDSRKDSKESGSGKDIEEERAAFEEAFRNRFPGDSSFSEVDF